MRLAAAVAGAVTVVLALAGPAAAQLAQYGQFRLLGTIDQEVGQETRTVDSTRFDTFFWGSRYSVNADGFLLDPRLAVVTYSGSFIDRESFATEGDTRSLGIEPYRASLTLLPSGLHSLTLNAARSMSDFDLEAGKVSTRMDTYGAAWLYRGGVVAPETSLELKREIVEERFLDGGNEERTRSTLALRMRKQLDRSRPTFNYTLEDTEIEGSAEQRGFQVEGLKHRVQYDDHIRLGEQAVLTPLLDYTTDAQGQEANANLTLAGPLSPTVDGSTGVRYSYFDRGGTPTHVGTAQGQLTKRFTSDLVLTTVANGLFITGDGDDVWGGGILGALQAAPLPHLRTVSDYGVQITTGTETTVSHRGHLNAVSTVLPRHTLSGDYFVFVNDADSEAASFRSHSGSAQVESQVVPLTLLTARYAVELQQGGGERERHAVRLGADVRPLPALLARGAVESFDERQRGGGRARNDEEGWLTEAAVSLRTPAWLETAVTGRYGMKDVDREDRSGRQVLSAVTASATVSLGTLAAHVEAFTERDQDAQQQRQGVRGTLAYRFRAWTIAADAEFSSLTVQRFDTTLQRFLLRISRPIDFTVP